jgi:DNA invertase Pin-like site-specific DNA recombinase
MKPEMSAAGYVHVSTDLQVKSGESLNIQRQAIHTQAQRLGIRLRKVYQDAGVSGRTAADRPELQHLMADAPRGRFQTLIVHLLDRLGRPRNPDPLSSPGNSRSTTHHCSSVNSMRNLLIREWAPSQPIQLTAEGPALSLRPALERPSKF